MFNTNGDGREKSAAILLPMLDSENKKATPKGGLTV
jgi:hypothetical protein